MFTEEGIPKSAHQERLERIMRKSIISRQLTAQDTPTAEYHYDGAGKLASVTPIQTGQ